MFKILRSSRFLIILVLLFSSFFLLPRILKKQEINPVVISGLTMGTYYRVTYFPDSLKISKKEVKQRLEADLLELNRQMSTYREDSEITQVNRKEKEKKIKISPWFSYVLDYSLHLAKQTEGLFDPTIGPLVNLWGFGPQGPQRNPSEKQIKKMMEVVGYRNLIFNSTYLSKKKRETYLDLSSVAKGFSVDLLSKTLLHLGLKNHLVEIGGELKGVGYKLNNESWTIGIEYPQVARKVYSLVKLKNQGIATSGNYRNFLKTEEGLVAHTIDSRTGRPARSDLVSVTVLDKECMKADALATTFIVMGFAKAKKFAEEHKISALFILKRKNELVTRTTGVFKKSMKELSFV